jgi:hypothetical protein
VAGALRATRGALVRLRGDEKTKKKKKKKKRKQENKKKGKKGQKKALNDHARPFRWVWKT